MGSLTSCGNVVPLLATGGRDLPGLRVPSFTSPTEGGIGTTATVDVGRTSRRPQTEQIEPKTGFLELKDVKSGVSLGLLRGTS